MYHEISQSKSYFREGGFSQANQLNLSWSFQVQTVAFAGEKEEEEGLLLLSLFF